MWCKPFQNLRSTLETELLKTFPVHVACAWIGNSPAVAMKHYAQGTDDHFAKAAQNVAQSVAVMSSQEQSKEGRSDSQKTPIPLENKALTAFPGGDMQSH